MNGYRDRSDQPDAGVTVTAPGRSARQHRALLITVCMGVGLVVLLLARWRPVYSQDGPEPGQDAFESPVLVWKYPLGDKAYLAKSKTTAGDLLINGNMDQMGFYWRPPNHWIAGAWFEWFSTEPFNFPEFNDGYERGFYHTFPSSQRLQLWGNDYAGGLMQSAPVVPCVTYRFEAYGQSRPGSTIPPRVDVPSHMKVGIEPYGWMSGRSIVDYDPGLEPEEFPATVVWSPEATHNFEFSPYTVTAEALSETVTAIMYSYPEVDIEGGVGWNDTIWDTASLVQAPLPSGTLLMGDEPPQPDGVVTNVQAVLLPGRAIVEWDTSVAGSTQLLYQFRTETKPISGTLQLYNYTYLPLLRRDIGAYSMRASSPDFEPVNRHRVVLTGLPDQYVLSFRALSRWLDDSACVTSASSLYERESPGEGSMVFVPLLLRGE